MNNRFTVIYLSFSCTSVSEDYEKRQIINVLEVVDIDKDHVNQREEEIRELKKKHKQEASSHQALLQQAADMDVKVSESSQRKHYVTAFQMEMRYFEGYDIMTLKQHLVKKLMELEDEKQAVQRDQLLTEVENLSASSDGQAQKVQYLQSHKLKSLESHLEVELSTERHDGDAHEKNRITQVMEHKLEVELSTERHDGDAHEKNRITQVMEHKYPVPVKKKTQGLTDNMGNWLKSRLRDQGDYFYIVILERVLRIHERKGVCVSCLGLADVEICGFIVIVKKPCIVLGKGGRGNRGDFWFQLVLQLRKEVLAGKTTNTNNTSMTRTVGDWHLELVYMKIGSLLWLFESVWFPIGCGRSKFKDYEIGLKLASKRLKLCKFTIEAVVDAVKTEKKLIFNFLQKFQFFDVETIVNGGAEKDIGMEGGSGDKISGVEEERNTNFSLETVFL
ncbi:ATP binding microtubule motor family protein [Artemisia annua]|uniref:ATP binding microtubule motor family protein n=1 Tax=Artemisia annua TaxID=35608 RepID=A0A2U1NKH3_ARTAN|nr:ATP binding microtubule motor family protein [Artemisia annua]